MDLRTEERGGAVWLVLSGELDLATAPFVDEHLAAAQCGCNAVFVDLQDLSFMDVSGLSVFLTAAKRAEGSGGRFGVVNSQTPVRRVFEITGTTLLLDAYGRGPNGAGDAAQQFGQLTEYIDYLNESASDDLACVPAVGRDGLHDLTVPH